MYSGNIKLSIGDLRSLERINNFEANAVISLQQFASASKAKSNLLTDREFYFIRILFSVLQCSRKEISSNPLGVFLLSFLEM